MQGRLANKSLIVKTRAYPPPQQLHRPLVRTSPSPGLLALRLSPLRFPMTIFGCNSSYKFRRTDDHFSGRLRVRVDSAATGSSSLGNVPFPRIPYFVGIFYDNTFFGIVRYGLGGRDPG